MHVLDVVDGVLARLLGREVDVDLDRLVVAPVDQEPAREVDADLVDEVVEEHDVAAPLGHLRLLAAAHQVHELVEQDLDSVGVVAHHRGDRVEPRDVPVMVGAEDVDRPIEALELVLQVGRVRGEVEVAAVGRAQQRPILVVAVAPRCAPRRCRPPRRCRAARARPGSRARARLSRRNDWNSTRKRPSVAVICSSMPGTGSSGPAPGRRCRRRGSRPRAAPHRGGRRRPTPGTVHLTAGVVPVVLALDLVPGELEQARDRVAVGGVPAPTRRSAAGRVRRDHLHLDPLGLLGRATTVPPVRDLLEHLADEGVRYPQVEEARAGDLRTLDLGQRRAPARRGLRRPRAAAGRPAAPSAARRSSRSRRAPGPWAGRARRGARPARRASRPAVRPGSRRRCYRATGPPWLRRAAMRATIAGRPPIPVCEPPAIVGS